MKFRKDALYPGEWHLADGRVFNATPQMVKRLAERAKEMIAAGVPMPLAWEHDDSAKPMTAAERAKEVAKTLPGWVESTDLTPEGILEMIVDVPVAADAERIPAVRFASPHIEDDFKDGTGRIWDGPSILHLAATPRPVQIPQQPFQPLPGTSLSMPIRLSLNDYKPYRLGENMADDTSKKGDDKGKGGEGDGADARLKNVVDALSKINVVLPKDTTKDNFFERVESALLTLAAATGANPAPSADADPAAGNPVMMSMAKRLMETEKKSLVARANALFSTGRITKPAKDKLLAELGTVQLSLAPTTGELLPNKTVAKIEAYEELDEGSAFPVTDLSQGVTRPPMPSEGQSQRDTPEHTKKTLDDIEKTKKMSL
jgi:hypothetical protein